MQVLATKESIYYTMADFIISYLANAQCAAHNGVVIIIGACIFITVNATGCIYISVVGILSNTCIQRNYNRLRI